MCSGACIGKVTAPDRFEARFPWPGDCVEPEEYAKDAAGGRRVAVGIVAGAGAHLERFPEIAGAVKQAEDRPGRVYFGVDIERPEGALGAADVAAPFPLDLEPGRLPIPRVKCGI